jgi:hypothetical protein
MCEPNKPPPDSTGQGATVTDEQVAAMLALARDVALATCSEAMTDVMRCALIDDRNERLAAVAAVMKKYDRAPVGH